DMSIEAASLVLGEHKNAAKIGVDAIGQRKVDDAIKSAERHRRFGAIARQWIQPSSLAAGQNQGQNISHLRRLPARSSHSLTAEILGLGGGRGRGGGKIGGGGGGGGGRGEGRGARGEG